MIDFLGSESAIPWAIFGDCNMILLNPNEKWGDYDFDYQEAGEFTTVVDRWHLRDMGSIGYRFTWSSRREDDDHLEE